MESRLPGAQVFRTIGKWLMVIVGFAGVLGNSPATYGGLTSSEVILVVNGSSTDSRTLANHFVALRNIPAINVVVLEQVPESEIISVEEFRKNILRPLLAEIRNRGLTSHFQCIAYSADFPTSIDIAGDLKDLENRPVYITDKGSINGLTYLYQYVLTGKGYYADLNTNFYARRKLETYLTNPAGTFTAEAWAQYEELREAGNHAEASRVLEEIFREQPHQYPLLYSAAAEAALANERQRAIQLLQAAVNAGWNAGGFMAADQRLDLLRDAPEFQTLELLVDKGIIEFQSSIAFDARTVWSPNGLPLPTSGRNAENVKLGLRYLLSTVLGVTRGNGTSLSEAIEALQRSSAADFTHPEGGFYFCATKDVRSQTRQWSFLDAIDSLRALGFEAEIITDPLPIRKPTVLGVQSGTPSFSWASCGSQFVPGAIADNLTSYGGIMSPGASQTKLTAFLKAGAAGSSGTVTEPMSIHQKFPLPQTYVHYARGASLAEAFYMGIAGPYQLLIVGDPLCRPFSNAPTQVLSDNQVHFLATDERLELELDVNGLDYESWSAQGKDRAAQKEPFIPAEMSVLMDGRPPRGSAGRPVSRRLNLSARGLSPGYHEVTLRFAANDPLQQKEESVIPLWIGERNAITVQLVAPTPQAASDGDAALIPSGSQQLAFEVTAPKAKRVTLWHDWEQLAMASGETTQFSISRELLGKGPVRLQARAEFEDGRTIQSLPLHLQLE